MSADYIHQVVFGLGNIRVVRSQFFLVDIQSPAVIKLHLLILPLILTEQSQIIQLLGHVWVIPPQHLSNERERDNYNMTSQKTWVFKYNLNQLTNRPGFCVSTFSLISKALLHSGSASLYFPLFPYRTARLLRVAATWISHEIWTLITGYSVDPDRTPLYSSRTICHKYSKIVFRNHRLQFSCHVLHNYVKSPEVLTVTIFPMGL